MGRGEASLWRPMAPTAEIIVPTRGRPAYLDVALASIAPQAAQHGAGVLVVDDGPDDETRAVAQRHAARYLAHPATRGLNAARNTAIDATGAQLLVFVDDDVAVRPGWLGALLSAADACGEDVGVLTGPIHARFEDHRFATCGREGPPITSLDLGPADVDAPHAWGANMAVRRSAIDRAGRFDERRELYGDEQEWQDALARRGRAHPLRRRRRPRPPPRRRRRPAALARPRGVRPRAGQPSLRRLPRHRAVARGGAAHAGRLRGARAALRAAPTARS